MWKADAMFGNAGSIMSIASGLSAMMDAITITNSGKPIGRWPEAAKALALVSDNKKILFEGGTLWILVRCTNNVFGMADHRPARLEAGQFGQAGRLVRPAGQRRCSDWLLALSPTHETTA
jgi:hypothetical protein